MKIVKVNVYDIFNLIIAIRRVQTLDIKSANVILNKFLFHLNIQSSLVDRQSCKLLMFEDKTLMNSLTCYNYSN